MKKFLSAIVALAAVVGILFLVSAGVGGEAHGGTQAEGAAASQSAGH